MPEKPLLISGAKLGVLVVKPPHTFSWWAKRVSLVVGLAVVLVGAADVMSRVAGLLEEGNVFAFGPVITALEPSILSQVRTDTATSSVEFIPARIKVPTLGIDAKVVPVGNKEDGSMDTPKKYKEVAWYVLGAKVGAPGNAVFAGHVNNALTQSGVFAHLAEVRVGDRIEIFDAQNKRMVYQVSALLNYPADSAPIETIFTTSGPSGVVLVTCEGDWDPTSRTFERRLVVFAKPL